MKDTIVKLNLNTPNECVVILDNIEVLFITWRGSITPIVTHLELLTEVPDLDINSLFTQVSTYLFKGKQPWNSLNVREQLSKLPNPVIKCIAFDADDILVDWVGTALKQLCSIYGVPSPLTRLDLNAMRDRPKHIREMYRHYPDMFAKLPPIGNGMSLLLRTLGIIAGTNTCVKILTAAGSDHPDMEKVAADKVFNLTKLTGIHEKDIVVVPEGKDKASLLDSNYLLIDDWDKNTEAAKDAGAYAIHIPEIKFISAVELDNIVKEHLLPFIKGPTYVFTIIKDREVSI